jgi:hypothetical protein
MQADMLIHNAAIDQTDQVRWAGVVGARSGFQSEDAERSGNGCSAAGSMVVLEVIVDMN